jgi:membrane protease YdiL (CAAX protease family)
MDNNAAEINGVKAENGGAAADENAAADTVAANGEETGERSGVRGYKALCAKLGLMMCAFFLFRFIAELFTKKMPEIFGGMGATAAYAVGFVVSTAAVYAIPLLFAMFMLKSFSRYKGKIRELYKKPNRLARALGVFPAVYGFGYGTALITLVISFIISKFSDGESTTLNEILAPTAMEPTTNVVGLILMVFSLVVIAPVAEEFWLRGIVFDALKPYGAGVAITVSSILFGLMHGSVYMLFYTTAIGFALGYVRYATDSLFAVTIIHALVNSVAAGLLLLSSLAEMGGWENKLLNSIYFFYLAAMLVLVFAGVAAFISRIPAIRKYKIENGWDEISGKRKMALFFSSAPVIAMALLALNEHLNYLPLEIIGFNI